eukprot:4880191-Ditylum_brightwellii.AAC.1
MVGIQPCPRQITVFQAAARQSKAFLRISAALPHLSIPLGDDPDAECNPVLEGGADTMCGACVGNL